MSLNSQPRSSEEKELWLKSYLGKQGLLNSYDNAKEQGRELRGFEDTNTSTTVSENIQNEKEGIKEINGLFPIEEGEVLDKDEDTVPVKESTSQWKLTIDGTGNENISKTQEKKTVKDNKGIFNTIINFLAFMSNREGTILFYVSLTCYIYTLFFSLFASGVFIVGTLFAMGTLGQMQHMAEIAAMREAGGIKDADQLKQYLEDESSIETFGVFVILTGVILWTFEKQFIHVSRGFIVFGMLCIGYASPVWKYRHMFPIERKTTSKGKSSTDVVGMEAEKKGTTTEETAEKKDEELPAGTRPAETLLSDTPSKEEDEIDVQQWEIDLENHSRTPTTPLAQQQKDINPTNKINHQSHRQITSEETTPEETSFSFSSSELLFKNLFLQREMRIELERKYYDTVADLEATDKSMQTQSQYIGHLHNRIEEYDKDVEKLKDARQEIERLQEKMKQKDEELKERDEEIEKLKLNIRHEMIRATKLMHNGQPTLELSEENKALGEKLKEKDEEIENLRLQISQHDKGIQEAESKRNGYTTRESTLDASAEEMSYIEYTSKSELEQRMKRLQDDFKRMMDSRHKTLREEFAYVAEGLDDGIRDLGLKFQKLSHETKGVESKSGQQSMDDSCGEAWGYQSDSDSDSGSEGGQFTPCTSSGGGDVGDEA